MIDWSIYSNMYAKVNILSELETDAETFIMDNDRMLYRAFFETVERFCANNSVLLGGRVGIDLLMDKPFAKDSFFWDLYCDDTFNTARDLVVELSRTRSPHIPANTAALQTNIRYKEFTIFINARALLKVYSMDKYRGIKLIDLMGSVQHTSYFTNIAIKCVPEDMQLIAIYRVLYTPARLSLWASDLENEAKIYGLVKASFESKAAKVVAGGARETIVPRDIYDCLIRDVIKPNSYVLIGDHAMARMNLIKNPLRVQFIAHDDIEDVKRKCERCLTRGAKQHGGPIKITYVRYPLNLPDDFQIMKYTIYVTNAKDQVPIADVFNSSTFEMIPYVPHNGINIGNPWVLLRFLFIDIWILKLILSLGRQEHQGSSNAHDPMSAKIQGNIERADLVRTKIFSALAATFQFDNYAGKYIDESVAKKKLIKEIGERFPIFYPAKMTPPPAGAGNIDGNEAVVAPTRDIDKKSELEQHLCSGPIDLSVDIETKKKILMKIVQMVIGNDVMRTLQYHKRTMVQGDSATSKWGVGKSIKSFFYKNKPFIEYIPAHIGNYVDIGCGDGLDIEAVRQTYHVGVATCVDIGDFRDSRYKESSTFLKVELGKPIALPDNSADLVVVFHSLHHMRDDVRERLHDIVRITTPGGLIFIKDHDVDTREKASNVDFEHLVYMISRDGPALGDLIEHFGEHEPMTYYSRAEIHAIMSAGCQLIWSGEINKRTYVYGSIFKKNQ